MKRTARSTTASWLIATLSDRYELPYAQPDWLEDFIARYGLTPPPGR